MTVNFVHKSVLLRESVDWIVTDPKGIYVTARWAVLVIPML